MRECVFTLLKTNDLENWQEQRDKLGLVKNWLTYQEKLATAREGRADRVVNRSFSRKGIAGT